MPTSAAGSGDMVEIVRLVVTSRVSALAAVTPVPSVNCTVKLAVPVVWGVPAIAPAVESDNPAGSAPAEIAHLYGGVPPDAASVCEYGAPGEALGSEAVVITGGVTTVSMKDR